VKHSEIRARLNDYIDRDLSPDERSRVDAHLEGCGECRRELSELRDTVSLLRRLPEPSLPPGIGDAVIARIASGEGREARVHLLLRRTLEPRWIAPLAAGLAGLFFLVEAREGGLPAQAPAAGAFVADARSAGSAPDSVVLGGSSEPATRSQQLAAAPRAGVVAGVTPASDYAEYVRRVERAHAAAAAREAFAARPALGVARDEAEIAVQHRAARSARVQEMARLLRGAGHPYSTSLASHFEPRSNVVLADWQPR
jgi:anti-sigma factor RsiW